MDRIRRGKTNESEFAGQAPPRIDRTRIRRRIEYLARANRLEWLVDQESWHVEALKFLDDAALTALLDTVHRAIECRQNRISFEDAGLVRRFAAATAPALAEAG